MSKLERLKRESTKRIGFNRYVSPLNQREVKDILDGQRKVFGEPSKKELKSARRHTKVETDLSDQASEDTASNPFEIPRDPVTGRVVMDKIDFPESI